MSRDYLEDHHANEYLDRIATALERIADAMERTLEVNAPKADELTAWALRWGDRE